MDIFVSSLATVLARSEDAIYEDFYRRLSLTFTTSLTSGGARDTPTVSGLSWTCCEGTKPGRDGNFIKCVLICFYQTRLSLLIFQHYHKS